MAKVKGNPTLIKIEKTIHSYLQTHSTVILIDASYFIFYRFHAILSWWKLRHTDTYDNVKLNPFENELFLSQFHKLCNKSLENIHKQFRETKTDIYQLIISKDCPRCNIWRTKLYDEYKGQRISNSQIGPFFQYFYEHIITQTNHIVIEHPHLEADDCIALVVKYMCNSNDIINHIKKIIIIASDNDYMQLLDNNRSIVLYDLKYVNLGEKRRIGSNMFHLFCKIINGDKSDNITPIFKSALNNTKLIELYGGNENENISLILSENMNLQNKIKGEKERELYHFNSTLIHFDFIPEQYKNEFIAQYQ